MSQQAKKRLFKDFKKLQADKDQGFTASPIQDNIMKWQAVIFGPQQTPWQKGIFKLSLQFSQEYPNKPPKIYFQTKMFHPNIYNDGSICLDILTNQWSPIYDISAILTSIRSLLCDPNPNSPANQVAAQMFVQDRLQYIRKVKEIVEMSWDIEI